MPKWLETLFTLGAGFAVAAVGGLIALGGMRADVERLKADVAELQKRPTQVVQIPEADPIKMRCADLAANAMSDRQPAGFGSKVGDLMSSLGCHSR